MKKVGLYLTLTFVFYLIGQVYWTILIACGKPLFETQNLDDIMLNIVFTLSGVCGLMSGMTLYKLNR